MTALMDLTNNLVRKDPKPMRKKRNIHSSRSGQSLIEVALVAPLLLALVLGLIELGRFAYLSILVGNAARAGAAYGAEAPVNTINPLDANGNPLPVNAGIKAAAKNDFQNNGQDSSKLTVTSSTACGCDNGGTIIPGGCDTVSNPTAGTCTSGNWVVMVSVTASDTFNSMFRFPWISKSITVSNTVVMRVNQLGV